MITKIVINDKDKINIEDLVLILYSLDYWTREWKEHYGFDNRAQMKYWQNRADVFLKENIKTA